MTAKLSFCVKAASLPDQDSEALTESIEAYMRAGVSAVQAETMAVNDLVAAIEAERKEFVGMLREQHPDAFQRAEQTPEQKRAAAKARMAFNPETDSVLQAITKMGGMRRDIAASEFGLKPEELKHSVPTGGLKGYPFRATGGMGMDRVLTNLQEAGYFPGVSDEDARSALEAAIFDELGGGTHLTVQGQMREAQQATEAKLDADEAIEREALLADAEMTGDIGALSDDDVDFFGTSNASTEDAMRALGFSDEDIRHETAREAAPPGADQNGQAAGQEAPAAGRARGQEPGPGAAGNDRTGNPADQLSGEERARLVFRGALGYEVDDALKERVQTALRDRPDAYKVVRNAANDTRLTLLKSAGTRVGANDGQIILRDDGKAILTGDNAYGWASTMSQASVNDTLKTWLKNIAPTDLLATQTAADLKAKTAREADAAALDERAQINAERDMFGLQQQTAEQRADNTGDMFGGPTAEDVRRAKTTKGKAPTGPDLFSEQAAANPDAEGTVIIPASEEAFADALNGFVRDAVNTQVDGETDRLNAMFSPDTKPVSLPRVTSTNPAPMDFITPEEAAKRLASWKAEADRQGRELAGKNGMRTVISLFDASGVLSQPWVDAGYNVVSYDLQTGGDITTFNAENLIEQHGNDEVWAILAQPPCTDYASSGAQWWKDKDEDGRTEASNELVRQTIRTIELFRPAMWVMENPVGRIARLNELPEPTLSFDPWHFGDPYTKRTLLWGRFNNEFPLAPVDPVEGSKMHRMSSSAKYERSLTPEGFAYANFMANNAEALPLGSRLAAEFAGIDAKLFDAALKAGESESDIRGEIEDAYYDNDLEFVRDALGVMAGKPSTIAQPAAAPWKVTEQDGKFFLRIGDDRAQHGPFKTRAAAEKQGRDLTPAPKPQGAAVLVQRQMNAADSFVDSVMEQFKLTKPEALRALASMQAAKLVTLDANSGQFKLKDGRAWDADVMRRAAGQADQAAPELVEHVTAKGKTLRGVIRTDLTRDEAKAIDPYTFKKDDGFFIREQHLAELPPVGEPIAAPAPRAPAEPAPPPPSGAKLRALGEKMIEEGDESLGRDRNTNTARRVSMAAGAEAKASHLKYLGQKMVRLADAIEAGDVKALTGVTSRAQIELLDTIRVQAMYAAERAAGLSYAEQERRKGRAFEPNDLNHVVMPVASWQDNAKLSLLAALKGKKGSGDLQNMIKSAGRPTAEIIGQAKKLLGENAVKSAVGWHPVEQAARADRLERAGIKDVGTLREAIREYADLKAAREKIDPVKQLERALVGSKGVGVDFFPTPKAMAERMVDEADIEPGMRVLEPSAGNGNIADAIRATGVEPDTAEISSSLREILEAKKYKLVGRDFMELKDGGYDRILMNPPFGGGADMDHVRHAYSLLAPGGRIVAIVGEGSFGRSDKKATEFRAWLEERGGSEEKLPANTFMDTKLLSTTGANGRLVVIEKPGTNLDLQTGEQLATPEVIEGNAAPDDVAAVARVQAEMRALTATFKSLTITALPRLRNPGKGASEAEQLRYAAADLAEKLYGQRIVWFHANVPFANGMQADYLPGVLLMNEATTRPVMALLGHELTHTMRATHPALYAALNKRLDALLTAEGKASDLNLKRAARGMTPLPDEKLREERNADIVGDFFTEPAFWRQIAQGQPSLFARVLRVIRDFLDDLLAKLRKERPYGTERYLTDISAAREAVVDAMREFANSPKTAAAAVTAAASLSETGKQIDTPEFKRWFGDSKVVNAKGEPLVVYHGTGADFAAFDDAKVQRPGYGRGFHFAEDVGTAGYYAEQWRDGDKGTGDILMPVYLSIKNPFTGDYYNYMEAKGLRHNRDVQAALIADGYDGIRYSHNRMKDPEAPNAHAWVAFKPEQIKSAVGNSGAFDPTNPSINHSENNDPFYSELGRQIQTAKMGQGSAQAWKDYLKGLTSKGVKADEIAWTGIEDWLDLQPGKVTREAVLDYLNSNGVKVTETRLGATHDSGVDLMNGDTPDVQWQSEQTDGDLTTWELTVEGDAYTITHDDAAMDGYTLQGPGGAFVDGDFTRLLDAQHAAEQHFIDKFDKTAKAEGFDGPTKYSNSNYQLPGGTNYTELLLTLPDAAESTRLRELEIKVNSGARMSIPEREEYHNLVAKKAGAKTYQSGHWDQPNVLAHVRFNERTDAEGKRVLFIEEVQSDWGQAAKKKGFREDQEAHFANLIAARDAATTDAEAEAAQRAVDAYASSFKGDLGVPKAPFVGKTEAWVGLAIKRMVKYAVDNGFDRVAFVTGEQSADRYDLSKQIDRIEARRVAPNSYLVKAFDKVRGDAVISDEYTAEQLPDVVGKDVAQKVVDAAEKAAGTPLLTKLPEGFNISMDRQTFPLQPYTVIPPGQAHGQPYAGYHATEQEAIDAAVSRLNAAQDKVGVVRGLDLKVGGEGMKAFYDKIVPNVAKDVVKKLGGQMTTVPVPLEVKDYGRTSEYVGPLATFDQVKELYALSMRGGADIKANPITGRNEEYAINRVAVEGDLRILRNRMDEGLPFDQAIVYGDIRESTAALFGGRIMRRDVAPDVNQHVGFDITPAMREKAAGGLPMFSLQYTPEEEEALRKAGINTRTRLQRAGDRIRNGYGNVQSAVRSNFARQFQQGVLDQFTGLNMAVRREIGALPVDQDPYVAARLANGATSSVMRGLLLHGQAKWAANGQHLEKIAGTEGLLDILRPLDTSLNDFFGWMIGNRAARLMREGRENNFTPAQIAALQGLNRGKENEFRRAALGYTAFKRSVLDVAEEAGLLDPESRKVWDNADYIPFYREIDDKAVFGATGKKGLAGQSSGIRTLRGGEAGLNDPMENILMNFSRLIDASLKNRALAKTIDVLETAGSDIVHKVGYDMNRQIVPAAQIRKQLEAAGTPQQILDIIPPDAFEGMAKMWAIQAPTDPDVVRVMRGGKPAFYKVNDPLLLKSLTSFIPFDFPGLGVARAFKRVLTSMVTATPEFMARNFARDTVASAIITRAGFHPGNSLAGIVTAYRESGAFEDLLFAGASFQSGNVNATDPVATGKAMRRALRKKGFDASSVNAFAASIIDTPARFWEIYRHVGESIENANREAVYEATLKAGGTPTAAAYESKDLMDFSLRGSSPAYQVLADVLPFFNARVQGLYRLGRADPGRLALYGMLMTVASLALAYANGDNDDYDKLPDWDKETYWHFWIKGEHFRMPKPFELGAVFASVPERILRYAMGQDTGKKTLARQWAIIRDQLAFDPVPQIIRPALNTWANTDTFRDRPIENQGDEGKLPSERFSKITSPTTVAAVQAISPLADKIGLSPKKLEYMVGGYLGTAGLYALGLSDMAVRKLNNEPPRPATRLDELPLVRAFYRQEPAVSTVYETDLYKMRTEIDQVYKAVHDNRKSGNDERADKIETDSEKLLEARKTVHRGAKALANLNKQRDAIYEDRDMTPKQKREAIDQLLRERAEVSRDTMKSPEVVSAQ